MLVRGDRLWWTFFLSFFSHSHCGLELKMTEVEHSTITALLGNGITDGYIEVLNIERFAAVTVFC